MIGSSGSSAASVPDASQSDRTGIKKLPVVLLLRASSLAKLCNGVSAGAMSDAVSAPRIRRRMGERGNSMISTPFLRKYSESVSIVLTDQVRFEPGQGGTGWTALVMLPILKFSLSCQC